MSYLRTNKKVAGQQLDANAIGGGIRNWLEGSMGSPLNNRGPRFYGGLVMFSITATDSVPLSVATDSILASHYGLTMVSNVLDGGTGFRVVPIFINVVSELSAAYIYAPVFTQSAAADSMVLITARKPSMSAAGNADLLVKTVTSTHVHHIVVTGLIISTPFGPWS